MKTLIIITIKSFAIITLIHSSALASTVVSSSINEKEAIEIAVIKRDTTPKKKAKNNGAPPATDKATQQYGPVGDPAGNSQYQSVKNIKRDKTKIVPPTPNDQNTRPVGNGDNTATTNQNGQYGQLKLSPRPNQDSQPATGNRQYENGELSRDNTTPTTTTRQQAGNDQYHAPVPDKDQYGQLRLSPGDDQYTKPPIENKQNGELSRDNTYAPAPAQNQQDQNGRYAPAPAGDNRNVSAPYNGQKMNDQKAAERNKLINDLEKEKADLSSKQKNEKNTLEKKRIDALNQTHQSKQASKKTIIGSSAKIGENKGKMKVSSDKKEKKELKKINSNLKTDIKNEKKNISNSDKKSKTLHKSYDGQKKKQSGTHAKEKNNQNKLATKDIKNLANKQQKEMKKEGTKVKTSKPKVKKGRGRGQ